LLNPNDVPEEFRNIQAQICIDFDGVIHKSSKGYFDGTVYDDPVDGTSVALEKISKKYSIVICSAKAKPDRPLVNGKTGVELIWEWLDKHNLRRFVFDVTSEKPRATFYIDDNGIRFENWSDTISTIVRYENE